jgi:glycosyltransferase 2 family protein
MAASSRAPPTTPSKWGCDLKRVSAALALAAGLALMVWLLAQADWQALRATFKTLSLVGFASILAIYPIAIWLDALTWQPYFRHAQDGWRWVAKLWKAQVIADSVLYITPLGAVGSEASKALLLNRKHGISYSDATASLISLQLLLAIAQVPFIVIGMWVMIDKQVLPPEWQRGLIIATCAIALFMLLLMVAVHRRWLRQLLLAFAAPKPDAQSTRLFDGLEKVEQQISTIIERPKIFLTTLAYAFANWACFAFEMWVMAWALGKPISFADAWAIETLVSLARAATFFIPAHLGAQDGATSFGFKVFYADPTFGIAVALVRRARELIWALIALPLGLAEIRGATVGPQP